MRRRSPAPPLGWLHFPIPIRLPQFAHTGHYDGVILDVRLPDGDGLSIARALRRGGATSSDQLAAGHVVVNRGT